MTRSRVPRGHRSSNWIISSSSQTGKPLVFGFGVVLPIVGSDVTCSASRAFVKPAHGGEEKPGGEWPAAVDALLDRCARDAQQGLVAGSCQNAAHDIFAL